MKVWKERDRGNDGLLAACWIGVFNLLVTPFNSFLFCLFNFTWIEINFSSHAFGGGGGARF